MDEIIRAFELDLVRIATSVIIIAVAWSRGMDLYDKIRDRLGIETPRMRDRRDKTGAFTRISDLEEQVLVIARNSEKHDKQLRESIDRLGDAIEDHIEKNRQRTVTSFRSTIYRMHDDFVSCGYVTESGLKTFVECVKTYTEAGGNDIVHDKLNKEVLDLPIKK